MVICPLFCIGQGEEMSLYKDLLKMSLKLIGEVGMKKNVGVSKTERLISHHTIPTEHRP